MEGEVPMSERAWMGALAVVLAVIFVAGLLYVIVEWIYSDAPDTPRPWQRRRRRRPEEDRR
jgi:hypothetical protein